jgi:hypothetical protein
VAEEAGQGALLSAVRGPWTGGYTSTVPSFMARPDQLWGSPTGSDTNSSRNVFIDPFTGGVSRRSGCDILIDTVDGNWAEVTGLLNAKWGAKARKMIAIDSTTLTNTYPTLACLYSEDTNASFPTADSGFPGTLWVNDNGTRYSLLSEFTNNTNYSNAPSSHASASGYTFKMTPICIDSGDGVYNRGQLTGTASTDKFMQQYLCCGSRSALATQNWVYFPNLRATPWRWNKAVNISGTEILRGFPTGAFPPLFGPLATTPSASTSNTSWSDGDTFYLSVIFQFEDGSWSLPFIPRATNTILTSGNGLVTVGTIGGTSKYQYLTYSNVAIGPQGTVARAIVRSEKQTRTATTDNITVSPLDLRVIGVLRNNTQTSYVDYAGNDSSLLEDDDVVRFDYMLPRRARYIGTGDQRAIIGYTLPNTGAIMLAPVSSSSNTSYDFNTADDAGAIFSSSHAYYVRITSTDLELRCGNESSARDTTAVTGNTKLFSLATYDTVEKMVDVINTTVIADVCNKWKAQLAPGIDPTMPTASLTKTTMDIACTTTDASTTVTSAALFGPVGVGMKVAGTSITAGTYVVSKASASSLTLSTAAANPGAGAVTLTFYQSTGDADAVTGATYGYMRAFNPAWPLLLHMKPSAFPDYATPDKTSIYFSVSSPGAATAGVSLAPNNFVVGNRRITHSSPRSNMPRCCMGIVDIEGAAIVAFNDGIHMFANQRGANTGDDFDYRMFSVNDTRGCISYLGLIAGNGWAAYPTTQGIVVTDKNRREFVISGDIFNSSDDTGDLAYEIKTSGAAASGDLDDQYFSMAVMGSKLVVAVRANPANSFDARVLSYDFSPGVDASGVEELLNPETKVAYIWNPPTVFNVGTLSGMSPIGAMGSIRNTLGRVDYIAYDTNYGTGDGRIDRINTGALDNNVAGGQGSLTFVAYAVTAPVVPSDYMSLSPQTVEATHIRANSNGTVQMLFANDQVPTFNTTYPRLLATNALKVQYQKQVLPIDQTQRGKTDMLWMQWYCDQNVTSSRLWRLVLRYAELEN